MTPLRLADAPAAPQVDRDPLRSRGAVLAWRASSKIAAALEGRLGARDILTIRAIVEREVDMASGGLVDPRYNRLADRRKPC